MGAGMVARTIECDRRQQRAHSTVSKRQKVAKGVCGLQLAWELPGLEVREDGVELEPESARLRAQ
jgi:hypothetical protein